MATHHPVDTCTTCPTIRPDSEPRQPHRPPVCDGDRRLLHRWLGDIANLIDDLANPEQPVVDQRRYQRFVVKHGRVVSLGETWADPVGALGGVSPINSKSAQPSVSGSRERPIPINAALLDLEAPARVVNPTAAVAQWPEDQAGHLSAATVLDRWVRGARQWLYPDHHLPPATVRDMVDWLRTDLGDERTRTDDICDHLDAAAFADDIKHLRGALRAAAGTTEARPEPCGVPCRQCDLMTLFRKDGDIECFNPDCQAVMRPDEYGDYLKTLAEEAKIRRAAPVA